MQLVILVVPECLRPEECLRALLTGGTINISPFDLQYSNVKFLNLLRLLVEYHRKQMSLMLSTFNIGVTLLYTIRCLPEYHVKLSSEHIDYNQAIISLMPVLLSISVTVGFSRLIDRFHSSTANEFLLLKT